MANVMIDAQERIDRAQLPVQPTEILPAGKRCPARCRSPRPCPSRSRRRTRASRRSRRGIPEPFPPPDEGDRPAAADDPRAGPAIGSRQGKTARMQQLFRQAGTSVPASKPLPDGSTASPRPPPLAHRRPPGGGLSTPPSRTPTGSPTPGEDRGGPGPGGGALVGDRLDRGPHPHARSSRSEASPRSSRRSSETSRSSRRSSTGSQSLFELQTEQLDFLQAPVRDRPSAALNRRLIELYESDDPTTLDVLLSTESLSDFLDQVDYVRDLGSQDVRITTEVNEREGSGARRAREDEGDAQQGRDGDADDRRPHGAGAKREGTAADQREGPLRRPRATRRSSSPSIQQSKEEYLHEVAGLQASYGAVTSPDPGVGLVELRLDARRRAA